MIGLPDLLRRYRRAHPRYDMHFEVGELAGILDRVAANELDMAVVAGRPSFGELQATPITSDTFVVIAPPEVPLADKRRLRPADLRDQSVEEELKVGRLSQLPLFGGLPSREFLLIDHPHKHHGAACRAMMQLLKDSY